ncbi:MAG: DUF2490 domain-containing protein [Bacteroidia bacterium]
MTSRFNNLAQVKIIGWCCCFIFFVRLCNAQENDAGLWAGVNVEKKITSKWSARLTEELRFNENISELGTAYTEIGMDYRFYKFVSLGVSYRFSQKRKVNDIYSLRHRYNIDLSLKHKFKKISVSLRERFQTQYTDVNTSEDGKVAERYLRNKLTLKYDLGKKYTPYFYTEWFYQLYNPEGNELDNVRYGAGFDYEISKFMSLEFYYLINKELHVKNPLTSFISGVEFTYSF